MRSYFDTSVLFPALHTAHPNHLICQKAFELAIKEGEILCLSMHVYAELYANLTRFPRGDKIHPEVAADTIIKLGKSVTTIDLNKSDYEQALLRCGRLGLTSGIIYGALHLQAAIKGEVDVLFTANLKDFEKLWGEDLNFELRSI
jgi:predicted nucleic acid-binding protein